MRYLGCKTLLLTWLEEIISKVGITNNSVFADLFTGTTTVAKHFKTNGFQVITNDLMHFSYALQHTYIATNQLPQFADLLTNSEIFNKHLSLEQDAQILVKVLRHLNNLPPVDGFLYHNYTTEGTNQSKSEYVRQYFSSDNARKIDAIRICIEEWKTKELINNDEYYLLITSLLEAVSSVSNTAGTYGAFLKEMDKRALKPINLTMPTITPSIHDHQVYCRDANELIKGIECDVLYIDPPYNHRQYGAYYHLLDTLVKWDEPTIYGKTGRPSYNEKKSRYCTQEAKIALEELVLNAKCQHIFLSYNNEGRLSRKELLAILEQRGKTTIYEYNHKRYTSSNNKDQEDNYEDGAEATLATSNDNATVKELVFHVEVRL